MELWMQDKVTQNKNLINAPWLKRKIKAKIQYLINSFPYCFRSKSTKESKHSVFSFDSTSKSLKGKGCLTHELTPWEFSEFWKYSVALLSSSFIPRHHIMFKNCLGPNRHVYVWVELLQLPFFTFHIPNRD